MILVPIMIFWPTKKIKHTGFLKPRYSVKMFFADGEYNRPCVIFARCVWPIWGPSFVQVNSGVARVTGGDRRWDDGGISLGLGWSTHTKPQVAEYVTASTQNLGGYVDMTFNPRLFNHICLAFQRHPSTPPASLPPSPLQAQKPPHSRDLQIFQSAIPFHGPQHFVFSEGSNNGLSDVCDVSPWVSDGTVSPIRTPAPKGPLPHPPASWKLIVLDHMQCM